MIAGHHDETADAISLAVGIQTSAGIEAPADHLARVFFTMIKDAADDDEIMSILRTVAVELLLANRS